MGKIRVKTLGDDEQEKQQKEELKRKKQAKKAEEKAAAKTVEEQEVEVKTEKITEEPKVEVREEVPESKKEKKEKFQKKQQTFHSTSYFALAELVDKKKLYTVNEALELLEKLQRKKFDETVELHINTVTSGVSGSVTLPHGTGKKTRVAIASDAIIAEVEKGIINFDILVAEPQIMAKLAKVAKILGPKGLMPNPKNGTISDKPEEVVKKYEGGQISFKTEGKAPLLHLTVGKMSFGAKKLAENIESMLKAVKKANIVNVTLKSTMSPGVKLKI